MRYLVIILSLFLFACATPCERLAKKCPPKVIIKDSIVTEICYRDTVIYETIRLKYDSIIEKVVYRDKDNFLTTDLSYLKGNLSESSAQVIKGVLRHELKENDTIIRFSIDSALKSVKIDRSHIENREIIKEVYKTHSYDYALRYYFVITMIILILFFIYRYIKGFLPF